MVTTFKTVQIFKTRQIFIPSPYYMSLEHLLKSKDFRTQPCIQYTYIGMKLEIVQTCGISRFFISLSQKQHRVREI